jgi:hypothetical protein
MVTCNLGSSISGTAEIACGNNGEWEIQGSVTCGESLFVFYLTILFFVFNYLMFNVVQVSLVAGKNSKQFGHKQYTILDLHTTGKC